MGARPTKNRLRSKTHAKNALIHIERAHGHAPDAVCIDTIKRVIDQLRSLEQISPW
jgi:hypothetical protein